MKKINLLLWALLAILLVACGPAIGAQAPVLFEGQECPNWASAYELCDTVSDTYNLDGDGISVTLGDWSKAELTIVGGNVLVDSLSNVVLTDASGAEVDPYSQFLEPGTYYIERTLSEVSASFRVYDPNHDEGDFPTVNIVLTYARPSLSQLTPASE